jgi:hypothetical protein
MEPCEELKSIVLHHYGKFDTGSQAETIQELYSLQDGVVIIGNDPQEFLDERESILAFMSEGGSSQLEVTVRDIRACCEGTVGWTMDRVQVTLPNGVEIPMRHTRIFHHEQGVWKMVHLHASIAVPNESIGQ